jgi:hypothetical protein
MTKKQYIEKLRAEFKGNLKNTCKDCSDNNWCCKQIFDVLGCDYKNVLDKLYEQYKVIQKFESLHKDKCAWYKDCVKELNFHKKNS